jgi:flagellar FliL protein
MAEDKKGKAEEAGAEPKKSKMKLIIIGAVVLLLVVGGLLFFLLGGKKEEEKLPEEPVATEQLASSKLAPFVVNLKGGRNFLKLTMMIEFDVSLLGPGIVVGEVTDEGVPLPPPLHARLPMIRDAVLGVLASKTSTNLLTPEGKETLKEELLEVTNDAVDMEEAPITGVYFLEFLVQ